MSNQHLPCPLGNGCDSSTGYTLYDDGHGWCFSCSKGYWPKKPKPEELERVILDGFRGIPAPVCDKFNIHTYVDGAGNPVFREYTYPDGVKFRDIDAKKFWCTGIVPALGGMEMWNAGQSHYITVVEGEEDAAAAYHMLSHGKKTYEPIVWLTSASIPIGPKRDAMYQYLSKFETVKFCFENDKAGREAKEVLCQMLPNKVKEVSLTKYKDANEYLIKGEVDEFKRSWANAKVFTPDNIYHTEDQMFSILSDKDTEAYYTTFSPDLNTKIRGIPMNYVTLITGQEGLGKTELLRALEYDALMAGKKIGALHFEETKKTYLQSMASYQLDRSARDPDNPIPVGELMDAMNQLTNNFENLFLFEFKREPDVNDVLEQINYLVHVCGVEYLFFDPVNQFDPPEGLSRVEFLDLLSKKVAKYVSTNPVGAVWTAHVNDDGQVRDSRMIGKAAGIRINISRDVEAEDEQERNTTEMRVSKNRPFARTGGAGTFVFSEDTFKLTAGVALPPVNKDTIPF